jgi:hypothetical protein
MLNTVKAVPVEATKAEKRARKLLQSQERSGLSRAEFARRIGEKPGSLSWWKHEITRRERERAGGECALVPVRVMPEPTQVVQTGGAPYELELGRGRVLRLPRDFDAGPIAALVAAIQEKCPC